MMYLGYIITEDNESSGSSVRYGWFEADKEAGIRRPDVSYRQIALSLHTTRSIHIEPVADSVVHPLSVEDRRRLVLSVWVVVPSSLIVGPRPAREGD